MTFQNFTLKDMLYAKNYVKNNLKCPFKNTYFKKRSIKECKKVCFNDASIKS